MIGVDRTIEYAKRAARLTGLQNFGQMSQKLGIVEGGVDEASGFLMKAMSGMGDDCAGSKNADGSIQIIQRQPRIVRGLAVDEAENLIACWIEIWRGAIHAQRQFMQVDCEFRAGDLYWRIA